MNSVIFFLSFYSEVHIVLYYRYTSNYCINDHPAGSSHSPLCLATYKLVTIQLTYR